MKSSLYRDPCTGHWLQRNGSQAGVFDEIDTLLEEENASERAQRRDAITETLIPLELLTQLPPQELRGLELLLDVLQSSRSCRVSSAGGNGGRILCDLNRDADMEILVEFMVRVRLRIPWHRRQLKHWPGSNDRHLHCYLHRAKVSRNRPRSSIAWSQGRSDLTDAMVVCLESNHSLKDPYLALEEVRDPRTGYWFPDESKRLPVIDSVVSWALWAEAGFPSPPSSLRTAYLELTGKKLPTVPLVDHLESEAYLHDLSRDWWEVRSLIDERYDEARFWEERLVTEKRARWNLQ